MNIAVEIWFLATQKLTGPLKTELLSLEELARAARYRLPAKQRQFLLGRILGRELIGFKLGIDPKKIQWPTTGAPLLRCDDAPLPLSMSLSHTGQYIGLALSEKTSTGNVSVGLDFEEVASPIRVSALSSVVLTQRERLWLAALPESEQTAAIRRLWTAKEAILKSLEQNSLPELSNLDLTDFFSGGTFPLTCIRNLTGVGAVTLHPIVVAAPNSSHKTDWHWGTEETDKSTLSGMIAVRFPDHLSQSSVLCSSTLNESQKTAAYKFSPTGELDCTSLQLNFQLTTTDRPL